MKFPYHKKYPSYFDALVKIIEPIIQKMFRYLRFQPHQLSLRRSNLIFPFLWVDLFLSRWNLIRESGPDCPCSDMESTLSSIISQDCYEHTSAQTTSKQTIYPSKQLLDTELVLEKDVVSGWIVLLELCCSVKDERIKRVNIILNVSF